MSSKKSSPPAEKNIDDVIIKTLKEKFFSLALKEDFPKTPEITKELDNLTHAIRELTGGGNHE